MHCKLHYSKGQALQSWDSADLLTSKLYIDHRTIIAADKCLLFEPSSPCSRKFLNLVTPRLAASESLRISQAYRAAHPSSEDADYAQENPPPPFELEMVEGALMVATGAS